MTVEEEVVLLRAENAGLRAENAVLREQIAVLGERIAEVEGKSGGQPPGFVKANRPKASGQGASRKKRESKHNQARRRESPTQTVEHAYECSTECEYRLAGHSLDYSRQVIELPKPQPVEVTEHRVIKRYCPRCRCWRSPKLDLAGQVLGQGRFGVGIAGLVSYLRASLRLPLRMIQRHLETMHKLSISEGEIVYLLNQVREATKATVEGLKEAARRSPVLHADETGWREGGRNGYVWSFSTPGEGEGTVRYYEYDPSRAQAVVRRVLGDKFRGHLVSDFYCGYNDYECKHQRCWAHLSRDLHELKEKYSGDLGMQLWVREVQGLYDEARGWLTRNRSPDQEARERQYVSLVSRMHELGLRHAQDKAHPCWALCKRVLRHEDELFQFVLVEGLSADNNQAERSIRPLVVVRKISGGTRSNSGSQTRMALATLFGTWQARGLNPFDECLKLLSQPSLSPA